LPEVSVPDLPPAVPDPGDVDPVAALEPVTDLLPPAVQEILPPVQLPQVQGPPVQLPQLGER
jgi:hypothetical protein